MSDDATAALARIAAFGPYFAVGTGPRPGDRWQPTSALRDPAVRDGLVTGLGERMGTTEARVAASTLFFGYAARLWSIALGTTTTAGRCVRLAPADLLWCDDGGVRLHLERPAFGGTVTAEVLDHQVAPLVDAWRDVVAPGLLWGNTASALIGAGRVLGAATTPLVTTLLRDRRLRTAIDPVTGRRRSCCLFYRTPRGGVCGDCSFPSAPTSSSKEPL